MKNELKKRGEAQVITLDIGDFVFVQGSIVRLVIERKSISDFKSSIIDGRYRDQARRLREGLTNAKPMWLIEGNGQFYDSKIKQALINLRLRDGISVIQTSNMADTRDEIIRIKESLNKYDYSFREKAIATCKVKKCVKSNEFLEYMLKVIPGIGTKCAQGIANHYKNCSAYDFILSVKNDDLSEILIGSRKLGQAKAKKIKHFICL
ncbi:hypothetical protein KAH94_01705 [bacterium]|nr:hypothetical protein [bacterium]